MHAAALPTVSFIPVPAAEPPAEHLRNALMLLGMIEQTSPAVWQFNPALGRAQRRAEAAVMVLEYHGPATCAAYHVRRAIEALLEAQVDWEIVNLIPAAMGRLFAAWLPLMASAEHN